MSRPPRAAGARPCGRAPPRPRIPARLSVRRPRTILPKRTAFRPLFRALERSHRTGAHPLRLPLKPAPVPAHAPLCFPLRFPLRPAQLPQSSLLPQICQFLSILPPPIPLPPPPRRPAAAGPACRTHALCTNPYSSQKIITTIYTICIIRIDSFLYPMACPVQPREDIPFTNPSRSIPQRTLISRFSANCHPRPGPYSS